MQDLTTIGALIKSLRQLSGLTQTELAKSANASLRTIQRLENGETVKTDIFINVLKALGYKIVISPISKEVKK